jgi:uncharacterized metal-binding protein YceD (DUF177 family)
VDKLKDYSISFKGLKDGTHRFDFEVGDSFFELLEDSLISKGQLNVIVNLNKSQQMLVLEMTIAGIVESTCDNCLGEMEIPVEYSGKLYFKFGEEYEEESEEITILPFDEHQLNVARWIYEFAVISLPIRHVHPEDENGNTSCDPEMLEKLNQYLVDGEQEGEEKEETHDPRWDALKNIIDKTNK